MTTQTSAQTLLDSEVTRDVPYIEGGDPKQKLDIHLPVGAKAPFPTLFTIHGGYGDKRELEPLAQYLVQRGYAVISINFRDQPQYLYPAQLEDALCALAWTHANAATYGFDISRIVVLGYSLGGTLAALLGTLNDPTPYLQNCPYPLPEETGIRAVVTFTGIFDYTNTTYSSPDLAAYLSAQFGASFSESPETWAEASPVTWVDGSEPPFLLIHGEADTGVVPGHSIDFATVLEENDVRVELLLIPHADHMGIIRTEEAFAAVATFLASLSPQALIIIYNRFEEQEYSEPRAALEEYGAHITIAAPSLEAVQGHRGALVQPGITISEAHAADYDVIIFIGGYGYDREDPEAQRIAQEAAAEGKILAAICVAPITLANAGVLAGQRATTSLPASAIEAGGAIYTGAAVEQVGLIITANGPGAAREFAAAIVAALAESE